MAERGMTRDVLLKIISEFESGGMDEAKKGILDLSKLDKKTFLGGLGSAFKGMAANVLGVLNPLKLVHGLLGTVGGAVNQLGGIFKIGLGVVAGTAISTITSALAQLAQAPVLVAARVEVLETVLWRIGQRAGFAQDQLQGFVEGLKETGITTQQALNNLTRMIQANLDLSKATDLARVAQDAAVIAGVNSSEAFERLLHGITTFNPIILRSMGIVIDMQSEIKRYAAAHDVAVEAISATTKQQIAFDAVLRAGQTIAGSYESAMTKVGKRMLSLPRYVENAQLAIGKGFTPILGAAVDILSETLKGVTGFFEKHQSTFEGFGDAVAEGLKTGWERAKGYLGEITGALLPDFDPQAWFQGGVDLVVSLANGLLTGLSDYVIPAVISIAETIASFLLGASPPKAGPLKKVVEGATVLINEYLKGFALADFSILDQVGGVIYDALKSAVDLGDLAEDQLIPLFDQVRELTAGLIAQFRETGEVSEEMMGQIAEALGEGSEELTKYLRLQLEYEKALGDLAAVQEEYAEAETAGFISQELKDKLAAAEEAVDAKAEELSWQEAYIRAQQDSVDLQVQQLQVMEQLTTAIEGVAASMKGLKVPALEETAEILEESTDIAGQLAQAVGELPQKIDEARQKWKETFVEMFSSFEKLETPLSKLGDFVKGFIGFYSPEEQRQMQQFGDDVSEGYKQGELARQTFDDLVEGIKALPGRVGEWLAKLNEVKQWFEGLPEWVKKLLQGVGILVSLNFLTGGLAGQLTAALVGLGLSLGPVGWAAIILLTLVLLNKEELQRWVDESEILAEKSREAQIGELDRWLSESETLWEKSREAQVSGIAGWLSGILPTGEIKDWYDQNVMTPALDALLAGKPEVETATQQAITDPILQAGEDARAGLVGHSIVPEMVQSVIGWLTQMKTQAITLLTQLKNQAIQLFTQIKTQAIQLIADMVEEILEKLTELRDGSEEILIETAGIFESMAQRMGDAVGDIKGQILELIKELDKLIEKANEAREAMKKAGMLPESPALLALGLMGINEEMGRLHQQMGSVGRDFSDIVPASLTLQRMLNVTPAVAPAVVPAVAAAGSGGVVIQNYFNEGAFSGAFPAVRTGRDAGDVMAQIQEQVERAGARAAVPGGV